MRLISKSFAKQPGDARVLAAVQQWTSITIGHKRRVACYDMVLRTKLCLQSESMHAIAATSGGGFHPAATA
jgi:hypothetical protein